MNDITLTKKISLYKNINLFFIKRKRAHSFDYVLVYGPESGSKKPAGFLPCLTVFFAFFLTTTQLNSHFCAVFTFGT